MVSPNVDKVFAATRELSDAEREELRRLLDQRSTSVELPDKREPLRQALVRRGLLQPHRPVGKGTDQFARWQPVTIHDEPVSQSIIEERR